MSLRSRVSCFPMLLGHLLLSVFFATSTAAQQPTAQESSHGGAHLFAAELERAVDAGARVTPDGKRLSYFETKGSAKKPRPNSGRWTPPAESAGFLLPPTSSNRFSPRNPRSPLRRRVLGVARHLNINGARWRGHSVSGPAALAWLD